MGESHHSRRRMPARLLFRKEQKLQKCGTMHADLIHLNPVYNIYSELPLQSRLLEAA